MFRRTQNLRRGNAAFSVPALAALAIAGASPAAANADDANVGRYRFATGTSAVGDATALFATDGKIGPENIWVTGTRGRHRMNIFFERPTEIGQIHIYSGLEQNTPVSDVEFLYLDNDAGALVSVPGSEVTGNTQPYLDVVFGAPITTTQLQLSIDDQQTTIREVAVFPPLATPKPIGSGVNLHLARQHRLAFTTASGTAGGSSRRAVVDGFVNDEDFWDGGSGGTRWIALDMQDPPETNPPTVRWETTPTEIGSVHLYSGLESGAAAPAERGRFQRLDDASGLWVDIPGGAFSNNTATELSVVFDAPVTTAGLRLVIQTGGGVVREIVPLPDNGGNGWPLGTSVTRAPATDVLEYDDDHYGVRLSGTSLSMQTAADGAVALRSAHDLLTQHYQVLLSVGTDTYRIRNRITGLCLEPDNGSLLDGAPVLETSYAGFPTQRWRIEESPGGIAFVNSSSGLTLTATASSEGATLVQTSPGAGPQTWTLETLAHATKKGTGGFPDRSDEFGNAWAYNWGPNDTFPTGVDFWPMQWGSFFWGQRPSLNPLWQRNGESIVLMGYNEPDKEDQSNQPVSTSIGMWPRLEVQGLPLLGPAVAGHPATSSYIQDFMAQAEAEELRLDYVGMHSYGGPNANSFINKIIDARNAWGRDVVVSEFSVVDWNNSNSWNNDPVYNWFAEVLWRMEDLDACHRFAVFIFTDDPANPISDNRGEMLNADGSFTPEGRLYAAWDGDTQIRTDTPYLLHNKASYKRIGAVPGATGEDSTVLGGREDDATPFRWRLLPGSEPGLFRIESVHDRTVLTYTSRGLELAEPGSEGGVAEFRVQEIQHGWYAIAESILDRRLSSNPSQGGQIGLASATATGDDVRWRLAPVYGGVPGPPRGGQAVSLGAGDVLLGWDPHGFRDLVGFTITRQAGAGGDPVVVAADLAGESFVDRVPEPGVYSYTITAVGDTGESEVASLGTVSAETCPADFNADFVVDEADVEAAINAIGAGLDFNSDGSADFFDLLDYLRVHDEGCTGN